MAIKRKQAEIDYQQLKLRPQPKAETKASDLKPPSKRIREPASTEVDAYIFIKENLRTLNWDTRNPQRVSSGQVYTQNECLSHIEIKRLLGLERPENVSRLPIRCCGL